MGSRLTVWFRHLNEAKTLDFKGTTDALLDHLADKHRVNLPVADLLFSNVGNALKESIISSEYLGLRTVQGIKCHQLSFESAGTDWQIWIEADATPVPRRFAVTYLNEKGEPQFMAQLEPLEHRRQRGRSPIQGGGAGGGQDGEARQLAMSAVVRSQSTMRRCPVAAGSGISRLVGVHWGHGDAE